MRKNVAGQKIGAQLVSATDGSAFTGSVTVYVTGDAGTQAVGSVGSGACTHEGNGYHTYAPSQAETNYDLIAFTFTGTGAVPVTLQVYTRYDSNITHVINDATPATNLKSALDGTGYNVGNGSIVTASVTGNVGGNVVGSVASVVGNVGGNVVGSVSSVVGNVGGNVVGTVGELATQAKADVNFEVASALATYDAATNSILASEINSVQSDIAALNNLSATDVWSNPTRTLTGGDNIDGSTLTSIPWNASWDAEVQSEVQDAIEANNLDHLVKIAVDATFDNTVHSDSIIGYITHNGTGTGTTLGFNRTIHSLEEIGDTVAGLSVGTGGGGVTDWTNDERSAIRTILGFNSSGVVGDVTSGILDTIRDNISTVDNVVDAIQLKTDNLPSDPADASDIASSFTTVNTKLDTITGYIDTEVSAIKAKTDNLPTDPADASDIAASFATVNGKLDAIDDYIDTEIGAIKSKTDQLTFSTANRVDAQVLGLATNSITSDVIDTTAVTELQSGLSTLDAAGIRNAVGLASANLDTQLDAIPTASENATAILAAGDVDGYTLEQTLKLCLAALAGKLSGAQTTTIVIRAADDSKARITATVDGNGNRTAVTLDAAG